MESRARLNTNIDLISDLLEDLSDSSFETEDNHTHGDSSSGSESAEDNSNSPTGSGAGTSDNSEDDKSNDSEDDKSNDSEDDKSNDSEDDKSNDSEDNKSNDFEDDKSNDSEDDKSNDSEDDKSNDSEDDKSNDSEDDSSSGSDSDSSDELDVNFKLDKFDRRLGRLIGQAFEKFNKDLEVKTKALSLEELQSENRSELESCLVSFYSKLREQAASCLYTFYGPKSYEFSRLILIAISREERKAQKSFNKLWVECCDRQAPPVILRPPPPRAPRPPPKLPEEKLARVGPPQYFGPPPACPPPVHEPVDAQKTSQDIGAGDKKSVWNHITISRDQTRASDFTQGLLKTLFRISNRNQPADDKNNTNNFPHAHTRESSSFEPVWRGSPTRTLFRVLEQRERKEVVFTQPQDYFKPSFVSPPLAINSDPDQSVLSHRKTAANMKDQPQPDASGETEILRPEISGENSECGMPGPVSGTQPKVDGSFDHEQLMDRLASLETENRDLKEANRTMTRSETVYFIQSDYRGVVPYLAYLDEPTWVVGPSGETVLKSHFVIPDMNGYLQQNKDVAFVINKYYDYGHQDQEVRAAIRDKHTLPRAECSRETVRLQSFDMIQAAEEFFGQQPKFAEEFPGLNIKNGVGAPYLFWYYYRSKNALEGLSPTSLASMKLLTSWIEENYGELYDLVEDQLERGVISAKTIKFLVKPGDVVVWKEKRDLTAAVAESWLWAKKTPQARHGSRREEWGTRNKDNEAIPLWKSSVRCWNYGFDGSFHRRQRELEISFEAESQEEEVPITTLSAYPLQYAPEEWKETLDARGKMFWSCRHQRIASYEDDRGFYGNSERFMFDFHTYEQLHSDSNSFKKSYPTIDDPRVKRMDPEVMASVSPPAIPDLYVFPNTIPAYNLRSKKWVDLEVDQIRDVTWNKKSFEHLVVDIETKDIIQALITNQIARGQGTDTIDGKGNGLIILLHGGPGTGKTFTAESVAEMAEKPLFRVTCGDIGTKPEEVEKYLESVLHLGKNWGCVVLLDEADVFLEQRTLTDLERNALVSVFLRVLEYYEGILILTSNRVGTFDEAFKSRIQLSLHYENLTEGQRGRIWKNFLSRLKDLERQNATGVINGGGSVSDRGPHSMGIDFDDVECYLSDLARVEMNGRQIRNAITTARQLAKFKGELMAYHHLRHVIKVSSKFDSYLKNVQEGYSDDQIARGGGIR